MTDKVLRVEFRDRSRRSLRLKAERFERDPDQPTWLRFLGEDGRALDTRVNVSDVVNVVNEEEEAETHLGIA